MARTRTTPSKLDATHRIVILRGPDRYLHTAYTQELITAIQTQHGEIGQFAFDGRSVDAATVLDELRSYGLLNPYKLVILDHADAFLATKDEDKAAGVASNRSLLERYAQQPVDSATLLLRAETWRPGKLDKAVEKIGAIIKCDPPNASAAVRFCRQRAEETYGRPIAPEAAEMLVDRIGPNLARLDTELGKLASYVGPAADGVPIDANAVRTMVGLSREEKAWIIQSVLLRGDAREAVRTLRELLEVSRQPEQLIVWSINDLLVKLHAAARMLERSVAPADVAKTLRLWGDARQAVLGAARRVPVDRLAQLLQTAIAADRGTKRGIGNGTRTLEVLTIRIADTFKRVA